MLSRITKWAGDAYTDWVTTTSSGKSFTGFLTDPMGATLNFAKDRATDYLKSKVEDRFNLSEKMGISGDVPYGQVSAGKASSRVPDYGKFTSQQARVPGMRNQTIRNSFDNLYNSPELKVRNVQLAVEYTRPNIRATDSTIALGSSNVGRQKINTTTKSALKRTK